MKVLLDSLVGTILDMNIRVPRVALENNIIVFRKPGQLSRIVQREISPYKHFDKILKLGRFTAGDDVIIQDNWNKLVSETGVKEEDAKNEVFKNDNKTAGLKLNIIGYFLAQGLPKPRLATQVVHQGRRLICARKGRFSAHEDQTILSFVKTKGKKWSELARLLARTNPTTVRERHQVLLREGATRKGQYTVEESLVILADILADNPNILEEKTPVTPETCRDIASKLGRNHASVCYHWKEVLEPTLLRYLAGTLHTDIREDLVSYLLVQGVKYAQEVDWEELTKLPEFAGATPRYLQNTYRNMVQHARDKNPDMSIAEITTEQVKHYMDNRLVQRKENLQGCVKENSLKRAKTQKTIIEYYLSNVILLRN